MKTTTHRISALAIAMLLFAALVGYSPTSHASITVSGCGYSRIGSKVMEQDIYAHVPGFGHIPMLIGRMSLFYSDMHGGINIACLTHEGIARDVPLHTAVKIWRCSPQRFSEPGGSGCEHTDAYDDDIGKKYRRIAGPVEVNGTYDRCVIVYGHIQIPATRKVKIVVMKAAGCGRLTSPQVIDGTLP